METLFKTYKAEIKSVDENTGEIDMLIPLSTNSIDRDGDVIEPQAFKKVLSKFMKHPVLVASHNYGDLLKQIGEWTKLKITDTGLEGKPKYYVNEGNPEADWAFNLAKKGRAAFSVGFIPDMDSITEGDGIKTPRRTFKNINDLLEISQCIIPSNRDAIQTIRAKSVNEPIIQELCNEVEKDLTTQNAPITKPEENDNTIRIPVSEGHADHKIRTIDISDNGIKGLFCIDDKEVITYLFSKDKGWDLDKAKKWVEDHKKSVHVEETINVTVREAPKQISQEQLLDEIDFIKTALKTYGANDKVKESLKEFATYCKEDVKPVDDTTVKEKINISPIVETPKKSETTLEDILNEIKNTKIGG